MPSEDLKPLRADARRNRSRVLAAAAEVFVEQGPDAPLEAVAQKSGVGIGTLYRHFPNRPALVHAVALDAIERTVEVAERVLEEEPDAFDRLRRYAHAVLDLRIGAVIPTLLPQLDLMNEQLGQARDRSVAVLQRIVDAAQASGVLDPEVTSGDIGLMLVRLSRPLPGGIPPTTNDQLAHRHLDLLVNGLLARPGRHSALPGPALTPQDLRDPEVSPSTPDS